MALQFDPSNLFAARAGEEHGLTPSEIKSGESAARAALAAFRKSYDAGTYGFPGLPEKTGDAKSILKFAASVEGKFDTICVAGIGGSALGAWALDCALRGPHPVQPPFSEKNPRLVILDNVDPSFVMAALDSMSPKKTLVVVIAKSGSTAETISTFLILRAWLTDKLGKKAGRHIAVVTSEGKGDLKLLATSEGWETFHLPDNVGGRFSVLSAVGLLPAALIGVDIRKLLKGAAAATAKCWSEDLEENIALRSALLHYLIWTRKNKTIQVAFPYSNRLWGTAFWFRQLWAESLGKARTRGSEKAVNIGQTPVAALGTTDQHSQVQLYMEGPNDKVFTFWGVNKFPDAGRIPKAETGFEAFDYLGGKTLAELLNAERRATAAALTTSGRPNCTFLLDRVDEEHLGGFLQTLEFQTAFMGEMLNIDAFDQPGVELGKKYTFALMGRAGYEEYARLYAEYEKKGRATDKLKR